MMVTVRIVVGIIIGIIIWNITFSLNPFRGSEASTLIVALLPIVYIAIISCGTGFITAIISGKYKVGVAVIPVFLSIGFLMLVILIHAPAEHLHHGVPYFFTLCGISLFFSALGGILVKALRLKLPI